MQSQKNAVRLGLLTLLMLLCPVALRAQSSGGSATMTSTLVVTQGQTITYTVVITNSGTGALSGVVFSDLLDTNTTFVEGSVNTSPIAMPDGYSVLGNVQITSPISVLDNDVDPDGVGPALFVTATNFMSVKGGDVSLATDGNFTYNPPRGFEGADTFAYILHDGEGFTNTGTVTLTISGMIWFVNNSAPAGDGRLTSPFNSLNALTTINNGVSNNPATNDSIFLYTGSGNFTGPLTLLNNQKLIGQGATASLSTLTGLTPPVGSLALPATGGLRPHITGMGGGVTLASGNLVRGLDFHNTGGTSLGGGSVGALTVTEVAVFNTGGVGVNLANGALTVALDSVSASGAANGLRLVNCAGSFTVNGNGASARNGTGGTIQNTSGNGIHLENAVNVSLWRMNINNCLGSGLFGQNLNGLVIDWCSFDNNGDATDEAGILIGNPVGSVNGLVGTVPGGANPTRIANTHVRACGENNVSVFNNGGTLTQFDVINVQSHDTRVRPLGADGFLFEVRGNGSATVNFNGCSFTNNFTQGIQASALAQSALSVTVTNCAFTNNNEGVVLANATDADLAFDVVSNRFFNNLATGASGAAISAVNASSVTSAAAYSGKIRNNTVAGGGIDNHLVPVLLAGAGQNTLQIANNNINAINAQFSGIFLQAGETGSGALNANTTITGNTATLGPLGSHGILVQSRTVSTLCSEIANNVSTTGGISLFGINLRQRDVSTFRLPGFAGPYNSTAAVIAFVQSKNPGSTVGATVATAYSGGAACTLPLLANAPVCNPDLTLDSGVNSSVAEALIDENGFDQPPFPFQSEISREQLAPVIAAARQLWADTGLTADQRVVLSSLRFEIADLGGRHLGMSSNRVIYLDRRANGYGWAIDPSVLDKRGRMDLLSAVLHEMGHALGLPDDYAPAARDSLMYGFLVPGERRQPRLAQARDAAPHAGLHVQYVLSPINIGTLPAGKSITITFQATVKNPMPPGICVITNQGIVTAGGGVSFVTDDPRTAPLLDPTLTEVLVPPYVVTEPATAITGRSAILNGAITPFSDTSSWFFQYGTTTNYGLATLPVFVLEGVSAVPVNATVSNLQAGVLYHFCLVGTNSYGSAKGADLTFTALPSIIEQPGNAAACVGGTASFSVTPDSPAGVTFQWQRRDPGAEEFNPLPGATNQSYVTPPLTTWDDGAGYRVIVTTAATNFTSSEALLAVISLMSPTLTYDFNSGLPANTAIYGNAFVSNGVLELNADSSYQDGAFLTTDLAPGRLVLGFGASFKARLSPGFVVPADGFSFNWAADLPNGTYAMGEEGAGSGLRVSFDTFDNGGGEAPACDVFWGTNLLARRSLTTDLLVGGLNFRDVQIRLTPDGLLDVTYDCQSIFARLHVDGYTPQLAARFGLGARTGYYWETHGIDDLALELYLDPADIIPAITSLAANGAGGLVFNGTGTPGRNYSLQSSTNLVTWTWRANVLPNASGLWQFVEPTIGAPPCRFYRLLAAPQLPSGLVTWYRADNNTLDSFGPNHGVTTNNLTYAAGQRGQAFQFDGTNSSINIGAAAISTPWTAAFWVKRWQSPDTSSALLVDAAQGLKLEQHGSPTRAVGFTRYGVADYVFNYTAPSNMWAHLTFVSSGGSTLLYVNGNAQATNFATISLPLGKLGQTGGDRLKGQLDEMTLFNRALTPAEIQQVFNSTRGP